MRPFYVNLSSAHGATRLPPEPHPGAYPPGNPFIYE